MGMAFFSFFLVVIFQIHFADFALGSIDAKGQPQIAVTLKLHVPLRSPVNRCAFQAGSPRNSSASSIPSRKASILLSLSAERAGILLRCPLHRTSSGPYERTPVSSSELL